MKPNNSSDLALSALGGTSEPARWAAIWCHSWACRPNLVLGRRTGALYCSDACQQAEEIRRAQARRRV